MGKFICNVSQKMAPEQGKQPIQILSLCCFVLLTLVIFAGNVSAHHSAFTTYDESKTIEIEGVILDFRLRSPHSSIAVETEGFEWGS